MVLLDAPPSLGQRSHGPAITRHVRSEQPSSCRYLLGQSNLVLAIAHWVRAACSNYYYPSGQYSHGHSITRQVRTAMALPLTMAPDQSSQAPVATYRVSYSNAFLRLLGHKQFNSRV